MVEGKGEQQGKTINLCTLLFFYSSRPGTAQDPAEEADIPHPTAKKAPRKKSASKKTVRGEAGKEKVQYPKDRSAPQGDGDRSSRLDLIYTVWDLTVSPIQDNPKVNLTFNRVLKFGFTYGDGEREIGFT